MKVIRAQSFKLTGYDVDRAVRRPTHPLSWTDPWTGRVVRPLNSTVPCVPWGFSSSNNSVSDFMALMASYHFSGVSGKCVHLICYKQLAVAKFHLKTIIKMSGF